MLVDDIDHQKVTPVCPSEIVYNQLISNYIALGL